MAGSLAPLVSPSLDKRGQEFDGAGMADAWRELIECQLGGWEVTFCYRQVWSRAAPCQVIWEISLRARQSRGMQDSGWLSVAHLLPLSLLKLHLVGGVCLSPQLQFTLCHFSSAGPPPPPVPGVSAQPPPASPAALGFRKLDKQSPGRGALCLPRMEWVLLQEGSEEAWGASQVSEGWGGDSKRATGLAMDAQALLLSSMCDEHLLNPYEPGAVLGSCRWSSELEREGSC